MEARWLASSASAVLVPDHATQALSRGGELVFELPDPLLGGAGFGGAGVPLGHKLAVDGLQVGNPGDQLGPVRPVDLGAEMQAQALVLWDDNPAPAVDRGWEGDRLACRRILATAGRSESSWRRKRAA